MVGNKAKLTMFWVVVSFSRFRRLSESHNELLGYCVVLSGPIPIWELNVYFATEACHVLPFSVRLG